MNVAASATADHAVGFYDTEADLTAMLRRVALGGIESGDAVMVLARGDHLRDLTAAIETAGFDLAELTAERRFVGLDAEVALSRFVVDGELDRERFVEVAEDLLARCAPGTRLHVFGEMVSLLWSRGRVDEAIELERWWNDMAAGRAFSLCCPCRLADVLAIDDLAAAHRMCAEHGTILPPRSYISGSLSDDATPEVSDVERMVLPVPEAIGAVRSFVARWLTVWHRPGLVADGVLMASELATNSVRHSRSPFRVRLQRVDGTVLMSIHDLSGELPIVQSPGLHEPRGRGVALVERLSRRWGAVRLTSGKLVWVELAA